MTLKDQVTGTKSQRSKADRGGMSPLRRLDYPANPPAVNIDNLNTFTLFPNHGHLAMANPAYGQQGDHPKYLFIRMSRALSAAQLQSLHKAAITVAGRNLHSTTKNHGDEFHQVGSFILGG